MYILCIISFEIFEAQKMFKIKYNLNEE